MQPIVRRRPVGSLWSTLWLMAGAASWSGCAPSLPTMEEMDRIRTRLTEETLHLVEGTYHYESSDDQCQNCSHGLFDYRVLGNLARGESDVPSDSASIATVRVVDGERLLITSYLDGRQVERKTLHGRINRAGYFEAAKTDIVGPFPLLWSLGGQRAGVGVTGEGQLVVIEAVAGFTWIGPFPFMGGGAESYYVFDRLDPNAEHHEEAAGEEAIGPVPVGDLDGEDP